jgi:hypothetical protein
MTPTGQATPDYEIAGHGQLTSLRLLVAADLPTQPKLLVVGRQQQLDCRSCHS